MKFGITFDYLQSYRPTKKHRKPIERMMSTCREIEVRELSEQDFPVAIKVTDYYQLPHDREEEYENMIDTIELRWDGKNLYREPRHLGGSEKGTLIYKDATCLAGLLKRAAGTLYAPRYIHEEDKEYTEGISIICSDDLDSRVRNMNNVASRYIICNGKVWEKSDQPYYQIYSFGDGSADLAISWTNRTAIDRVYYLATQRDLAIKHFIERLNAFGANSSRLERINASGVPDNIEIIIPESYTLKRDLKLQDYPGYNWSDKMGCYVKDYGDRLSPVHSETLLIRFRHDYNDRCLARVYVNNKHAFTNIEYIWYSLGCVLTDCKNVSLNDIVEIYSVNQDRNILDLIKAPAPCKRRIAVDIEWETDGEVIDELPDDVEIPENIDDEDIADYLSDNYHFLVSSIGDIVETEEVAV